MQLMRPYSTDVGAGTIMAYQAKNSSQAKESEISRRAFNLSRSLKQELGHIYANTGGRGAWTLWRWFPRKFRTQLRFTNPLTRYQTKVGLDRIRELNSRGCIFRHLKIDFKYVKHEVKRQHGLYHALTVARPQTLAFIKRYTHSSVFLLKRHTLLLSFFSNKIIQNSQTQPET